MQEDMKKNNENLSRIATFGIAAMVILGLVVIMQGYKFIGVGPAAIGAIVVIVIGAGLFFLKKNKTKLTLVITIALIAMLCFALAAVGKVNSFTGKISNAVEYETVQIAVKKDSGITADSDFSGYILGYTNSDDEAYTRSSELLEEHEKTVKKSKPYKTTEDLYNDLLDGNIEMIVLTSNTRSDLSVVDEEYEEKLEVILMKKYEIEGADLKAVDITKEPFTLYICGADLSSGDDINSTGRGDVNILLTVNPNTEKVNLQVIPRDTFVYIPCRGGSSKLSYSGWWGGVQSSIESIEDKFDVEINYYAKINFNGLIDLVDALGGITVNSNYTYSYQGYDFVKGENFVDGEKALRFVRARKMLPENELSRGWHQMEFIKGIFRKFAENPTYENSMAVLESLSENFVTNLPEEDYYDAFKLVVELLPQLQTMESQSIEGEYIWHTDEVRGTYQYYYYPAEGEVERVRDTINSVLAGE